MHLHYQDILKLTKKAPIWFDEYGVPRWCKFTPKVKANIYADWCCLLLICCQNCKTQFRVCMSWDQKPEFMTHFDIRLIHYGDPPNMQCCPAGPTMNCEDLEILEWWERLNMMQWQRVKENEIVLPDGETQKDWLQEREKTRVST